MILTLLIEIVDRANLIALRFDLIFPIIDKPIRDKDEELATHILEIHRNPEKKELHPFFTKELPRNLIFDVLGTLAR